MPKISRKDDREWVREDVVGVPVDRATLWDDGHDISFSIVKMPPNYDLGRHKHETWVAVTLLSGSMELKTPEQTHKILPGDFYFVTENDEHTETSLEEAEVMIIKAEPNIQYPIDEDGSRR